MKASVVGLNQRRDIFADVLIISVGVDDDVGYELKGSVEAGHECRREARRSTLTVSGTRRRVGSVAGWTPKRW